MSSRPAWPTERVPGQLGLRRETLSQKQNIYRVLCWSSCGQYVPALGVGRKGESEVSLGYMPVFKRMLLALEYVCRMHRKTEGRNPILTPISAISNDKISIKSLHMLY